jgi:hypothetical protein
MTAFKENSLDDQNESLRNTLPGNDTSTGTSGVNPANSVLGIPEKYEESEDPEQNAGIYNITPGPGDEDSDDDDDDYIDDDDEGSLIPIEGDEEDDDSLLGADEDEDIVPGTDMDDGDDLLDEDDDYDSDVNRSTLGDIGSNNSGPDRGRTTGRMIDHEPGTSEI